jgi:hypothetical protein
LRFRAAALDGGRKYMGDFVVYRIGVATGKILQTYSEKDAQRIFDNENLPRVGAPGDDL